MSLRAAFVLGGILVALSGCAELAEPAPERPLEAKALDAPRPSGLAISGKVIGQDHRPIAGARVVLYSFEKPLREGLDQMNSGPGFIDIVELGHIQAFVRETQSGPDGTYEFRALDDTWYTLQVTADGWAHAVRRDLRPPDDGVEITLAAGKVLRGRIVEEGKDSPVAGATVFIHESVNDADIIFAIYARSRPPLASVRSEADGGFEFKCLGAGEFDLVVLSDAHLTLHVKESVAPDANGLVRTLRLARGHSISGRVMDATGLAVSGARVKPILQAADRAYKFPFAMDPNARTVLTDPSGLFSLGNLPDGEHSLLVVHPDFAAHHVRDVRSGVADQVVLLSRGGSISGRITRAGTNEPVAGARLVVLDIANSSKEALSGPDGVHAVRGLNCKYGSRMVSVRADGFVPIRNLQAQIADGQDTRVDVALTPLGRLTGRLLDPDGRAVSGARVQVKVTSPNRYPVPVESGLSSADGRFEFELTPEAAIYITALRRGFLPLKSRALEVPAGSTTDAGDLSFDLGAVIEGEAFDPDGHPIADAEVLLRRPGETEWNVPPDARTDAGGRFRVSGLMSGRLDLVVRARRFLPAEAKELRIEKHGVVRGLRLVLPRALCVNGTALDPSGSPLDGALVFLRELGRGYREHRFQCSADGAFAFEELRPGSWLELEVACAGFEPALLEDLQVAPAALQIRLERSR